MPAEYGDALNHHNSTAEERMELATPDPTGALLADFPVLNSGTDGGYADDTWLMNSHLVPRRVPADWITTDGTGVVRVRGRIGFRLCTAPEITAAEAAE